MNWKIAEKKILSMERQRNSNTRREYEKLREYSKKL